MNRMKRILCAACLAALLTAAGCTEEPTESSAVTESSSAAEPSFGSSAVQSSETVSSDDESTEESTQDTSSEEPIDLPVYRDDEEPSVEQIVLPSIPEKGFSFQQSKLTLLLGSAGVIPYEFDPIGTTDKSLTWSSSNEKAVTVSADGRLTAVGVGVSYVKAETSKGHYAECRVEVVETLPLSPLALLIQKITLGNLTGWQFALCDVNMDGTAELLSRTLGEDLLPEVTVWDTESGEACCTLTTGSDEEWAVWERGDGSRFLLISFSQPLDDGGTRYVVEELNVETDGEGNGRLTARRVLMREAFLTENKYYAYIDGAFSLCESSAYRSVRSAYFAANRQLSGNSAVWVAGLDAEAVATKLQGGSAIQ